MATLKLRKPAAGTAPSPKRAPVRGHANRPRPTLKEAQALRTERDASVTPAAAAPAAREVREARSASDARFDPRSKPPRRHEPVDTRPEPTTRNTPRRGPAPNPQAPARVGRRPPVRSEGVPSASAPADSTLRLSKRMSQLGIASRREADAWIAQGWVRVDGRVVAELGSRVLPGQHITVDAKARRQQDARVTVLVNKPVGYVSGQAEDGYEPALVLVTPENQWHEDRSGTRFQREHLRSLVPAGRLDIDSVGLLVLTQDGRVARQLIGDDSAIEKEYLVRVATAEGRPVADDAFARLCHGIELDGEALRPAQVDWLNEDQLRFVLTQGKKRQIRRMCEAVGLQVLGLKRVRIGAVMLGDLPPGRWRYLRADESFIARAGRGTASDETPSSEA